MTAATADGIEAFDINHPEEWEDYAQRFEFFLEAQNTTDAAKKRATFLSRCGPATFQLAKALVAPSHLKDTSFETIFAALRDHLAPKPPELARRYEFHRRDQAPSESAAAYLAALRTTAQHCNFNDLDTTLRDRFVFGLQNDTVKRRLLAKKEVSLTSAVEEAVAAEAITREGSFTSPQSTSAPRVEPVHHGTTAGDDGEQGASEDVLRLRAGPEQQRGVERLSSGSCASCGGPHERRLCRFRAVQCRECGKTGHIAKVCRSRWQSGPRRHSEADGRTQRSKNAPRTNMAYCDDLAVTAINAVSQPAKKKVYVDLRIEGTQCQMEVDSGSTYSIISDATASRIFPKGCVPNLQPLDIIMRDYQANRIAVRGIGTVRVQFKDFDGQLRLVIVKGKRPSLLGLDWFPALGIDITGVQHIDQLPASLDSIFKDFASVFDGTLG